MGIIPTGVYTIMHQLPTHLNLNLTTTYGLCQIVLCLTVSIADAQEVFVRVVIFGGWVLCLWQNLRTSGIRILIREKKQRL